VPREVVSGEEVWSVDERECASDPSSAGFVGVSPTNPSPDATTALLDVAAVVVFLSEMPDRDLVW
jgi:hypothetical protein